MVVITEILEIRHALAFHAIENNHARARIGGRYGLNRGQQPGDVITFDGDNIKTKGAEFILQVESANDFIQPAVKL